MLQRTLDLYVPLQDGVPADSRGYEMSLEYMRHKGTIAQWARQHKGLDPILFLTEEALRGSMSGGRATTQRHRRAGSLRFGGGERRADR